MSAGENQRSEVGGQKSEVRSQKSEVRSQGSEVRSQRSGIRGQESEARSQRSESRTSDVSDFELRISNFRFGMGGCARLREMTFRNFRPDKHLGQAKSSQRDFKVRRLRLHGQPVAHMAVWPHGGLGPL